MIKVLIAFLISTNFIYAQEKNFKRIESEIETLVDEQEYELVFSICKTNLEEYSNPSVSKIREGKIFYDEIRLLENEQKELAKVLFLLKNLLIASQQLKNEKDTFRFFEELKNLAIFDRNPTYLTDAYNILGKYYFKHDAYEQSSLTFLKSLQVNYDYHDEINQLDKTNFSELAQNFYYANFQLGRIFKKLADDEKALQYYSSALLWLKEFDDIKKEGLVNYQIGNIWAQHTNNDSAIYFYERAKNKFIETNDALKLSATYSNLGNVYNIQEKLRLAVSYYDSAKLLLAGIGDSIGQAYLLNNMANLNYKLEKLDLSVDQFQESLTLATLLNDKNLTMLNTEALADVYKDLKSYDSAFAYYYKFQRLNEELYQIELSNTIQKLAVEHKTKEKEWEISQQKQIINYKDQQQTYLLLGVFLLIVLVILSWYAYRNKNRANDLLVKQKETAEQYGKEKSLLMEELHHRMKNNLQLISSVLNLQSGTLNDESAINAVNESKGRVDAMSLIHQKLHTTENVTQINIGDYIQQLIENVAFTFGYIDEDDLETQLNISTIDLQADLAIPLCIILNELITNSFKYAFQGIDKPMISVSLTIEMDSLMIIIRDNGIGIQKNTLSKKRESFGLKIVNTMVKQLNANLTMDSSHGTCYKIVMKHIESLLLQKMQDHEG